MRVWLEIVGLVGIFVVFAGVHQLWLAREEILYWLKRFLDIFRFALGDKSRAAGISPQPPPKMSTLQVVGGIGLIALGSFLCLVSLALVVFGAKIMS